MLVTLPVVLPMLAAAICIAAWGRPRLHAAVAVIASAVCFALAVALLFHVRANGIQSVDMGGWSAPFGITLVADLLGAIMLVLGTGMGLAACIYSTAAADLGRVTFGHYPLMLCLNAAISGSFLAGDLFNLYVWFELMLLSSFVLLTLGGERAQIEGAIKYVTLNLLSSVLFLSTVGLVYATTGSLNMADLAIQLDAIEDPAFTTAIGLPLLVAFSIKAAVFPVFFWLPSSYHTPPPVVSALFAGLLTKVGVYAIIRATTLMFDQEWALLADGILLIAGLTMVSGVFGAIVQNDMRRILSFHIVSQIGYMLMGLGIALEVLQSAEDPAAAAPQAAVIALGGAIFYIIHHIIAKTNLFLAAGAVHKLTGTCDLKAVSGLSRTHPILAGLFLISALALAGIPILSGFWAKLALVRGGLEAETHGIVAVSLVVSIMTLYSMAKIWVNVFWGEPTHPDRDALPRLGPAILGPMAALAIANILIGVGAAPVYDLAEATALQLFDQQEYIEAVLGEQALDAATEPNEPAGQTP
ncbi:MAG: proton-conducting transporter membrane subunit [Planctomycetota bacterium]